MQPIQKLEETKKIVLTGGHAATTAVATIEEILRRKKNWELIWIGARRALEGKDIQTIDVEIFPKMGVSFRGINAGRLQRKFSFWTIPSILRIPLGFVETFFILRSIKPNLILSFGGYVSFPVVFWARVFGIPVILHEQTAAAGRSNRFSSAFASKIALARGESKKFFPKAKCVVTGNPVMTQICEIRPKTQIGNPPVLLTMGGSRGAQFINDLLFSALDKIIKTFRIIHLTGLPDYEKALGMRAKLPKHLQANYEIYSRVDPLQIDGVYKRADIILSRAGANSVSEIMITKIPSILVPIPFTYENEQMKNAQLAEEFGIAKILEQKDASNEKFLEVLQDIKTKWTSIVRGVIGKKNSDIYASGKLVDLMEETLL